MAVFTDIPISALCSDGESFTPSPIYPTTCPLFLYVATTLSFCNGFNLAKTSTFSTRLANSSSVNLSISVPKRMSFPFSPAKLQIFFVAYGLSPVNIFVFTPILRNLLSVFATPFLGGSKNPIKPINVMSFSYELSKTSTPG